MATIDDQKPSPSSSQTRISVHRALGGGAVADVLLWKRRNAAVLVLAGASAAWYLFERAEYSVLSLLAKAFLLLVVILFIWARSASLLNRPLPPLPNMEVSDVVVEKVVDEARVWINRALAIAREIALGGNRKLFLEVILCLKAVSYVGSFFNFLTLVYIGVILSFTVPVLCHKYQDHVDEKLSVARRSLLKLYNNILTRTGRPVRREKKTE